VRLSGPKNGVLGNGEGMGTIFNDDGVGSSGHKSSASYEAAVDASLHQKLVGRGMSRRR
jgi:hypothetical protein